MRKGLVLNLISNIVFFVAGYVIHYFLGNTMPAASYGIVGTIMTVLDFEYMFLSNGARQSLSKEISMRRFNIGDVIRKSIMFQLLLVLVFFAINFFGAPLFGTVLNDSSLDFYFRIAAFLVPANGMYVLLLGINEGIQRFSTSALISTIYPIAKLSVIPLIIFVFKNDPVAGVEIGYLLALLFCIILGCLSLIRHRSELHSTGGEKIRFGTVAHNTLSFSVFFIVVSLVLSMDTLVVKSVVEPASMTGYYTGAVNFGKLSYYLMTAFFTIILPVVAKAIGEHDTDTAISRVKEFLLLIAVFILPIPVVISASSENLLVSFYHADFAVAAPALSCLSMSSFFMGMTVLLNMVHTNFASNRFSDVLSIVSLVVVIPLFIVAGKFGGITWIAAASMCSTLLTMIASYCAVIRKTGSLITGKVSIAVIGAITLWAIVRILFSTVLHTTNLFALAGLYAAAYAVYIGVMATAKVVSIPKELLKQ
ncbi:oligosaccharide flippase family protein [Bifidobacterium sp. SMB2]|uniref:Oligosaccharide flippase family protein n=1 Tax=Bifidobacterium saimiriisciurei TaxID=2661627 RepID=A0ABX0C8H8_9BIFI|nr:MULTISPECIES: oligosaccharide flippase family protein [Bifidobacterium]NEG95372.1 oligosaccharide flippase family protein [Bifidobacterium sp. SMB2]NEH11444.1 oligosaccharide flippase family protein [Bifidobacterium saimiriisciurei]